MTLVHVSESNHIIAMTGLSPVTGGFSTVCTELGMTFNGHIQGKQPYVILQTDQKSVKFKVAAVICWKI